MNLIDVLVKHFAEQGIELDPERVEEARAYVDEPIIPYLVIKIKLDETN